MLILGVNAAFHDSAACVMQDGNVIAAVEEERFNRIKHAKRPIPYSTYELPFYSIDYCLSQVGKNLSDIDYIAYSFDPKIKSGDPQMLQAINDTPSLLATGAPINIQRRFNGFDPLKSKCVYVEHHTAHAASAFYPSPFDEAAILTMDGRGEIATTTYNVGNKNSIERIHQVNMPHSIGILYERVTEFLGFLHSSDEGKVMAMASYGKPKYKEVFDKVIKIQQDGTFYIDQLDMEIAFGKSRKPWEKVTERDYDIACSLQEVLEKTVLHLVNNLYTKTKLPNLCLSGGVFLNCALNSKVKNCSPFKNVWIQPSPGDSGTALGAALWVDATIENRKSKFSMETTYLGPEYSDREIEKILTNNKIQFTKIKDVPKMVAKLLSENKIVGWFHGKMEFGPRALGSRSILASPTDPAMRDKLNILKGRENFRPVAPVILEEEGENWFNNFHQSPFMLFTFEVIPKKRIQIPAAVHVDGTARLQTINKNQNLLYYMLVKEFEKLMGIPLVINTSFNIGGEPIVCSPQQAIASFYNSSLDALSIGSYLLEK